jgi:hypothetical protein
MSSTTSAAGDGSGQDSIAQAAEGDGAPLGEALFEDQKVELLVVLLGARFDDAP